MKKLFSSSNLLLLGILSIAAFLRLYRIGDYITFLGDEGRDVLTVYSILHGHFTLLGPTSSVGGFFLGPIYYYFMAPFLWAFNYQPVGPAVMVALVGVATVGFVYKVTAEFFGKKAGLIASLLYAVSPLVITYSRSSWNPNVMPFFSLLTMYLIYKAVISRKLRFMFLAGICFGITMQLHYLATFLGVIIVAFLMKAEVWKLYLQKQKKWATSIMVLSKQYGVLLGGFLLGFSPFLAFEFRHQFANTKNIVNFVLYSKDTHGGGHSLLTIADVFSRMFGRLVFDYSPTTKDIFPFTLPWVNPVLLTISVLVGMWCIVQLVRVTIVNRKNEAKALSYVWLYMWLFIGVLLFGLYRKMIYDYYFTFMFPVPCMLVGWQLSKLSMKNGLGKVLTGIILIVLVILNLSNASILAAPNKQVQQMKTIADFALRQTGGAPFNFALITGGNSDQAYRYFMTLANKPPVTIENSAVDPDRRTVTNQLLVVCESLPCSPLGNSLWEIAGFGRAKIVGHWKVSVVEIYKLEHYSGN